ncbi:peptide ABC transporter ATPase [Thermosipho melanesiensis]|uniref:Oligopeptide/dipeptide ABC transporter, ATPase subunit n=2 Tax=Thermosipho melanesiensis TaxID=46541 RepID=A6LKH6_THEM4|nr:ABC transporter ATP-binding protein [Thermosipho melanesiensis]ABR30427.1 oligopeptide/dipeptide ABC transporter, ATPase subunit [Thermosipho melanesiensis BI429]APT73587.1 peptide ABC transporter ATPase [Thermosipho melanesiensis]OOC37535.1 peptide ABC transporter ATPase [Thermosipho melanesiensis]OOC39431.1 peptide ABC transporter ATPase [Thermosipho melanesiensis]OOC39494.1 peptide ABC transporter ATPase [Thermosipho melanesiensis]
MQKLSSKATDIILKVDGLKKFFAADRGLFSKVKHFVHAVDDVSFEIKRGKSLGLVGESGCGKTTTGKVIVGLEKPTAGNVFIEGKEIYRFPSKLEYHKKVQMIFQDPYESLNPRMTIFDIIAEPLNIHNIGNLKEREEKVLKLLQDVGLTPPSSFLWRYPHELSGGQRQRVAIARALVLEPTFIVADEPTSMLDVSVRTGVMNLLMELQEKYNMSYLYITHDFAVARYMCDKIAVMYLGKIVEYADAEEILFNPLHPYTKALLSAVPIPDPDYVKGEPNIIGSVSKPINPPPRCRFYDRCPFRTKDCEKNPHPPLKDMGNGHYVSCYLVAEGKI